MDKPVDEISDTDWAKSPIWEYALDSEGDEARDETWMRPVDERLPITELRNRLISAPLQLANGLIYRGVLGNISLNNPRKTRNLIDVTIFTPGKPFHLLRNVAFSTTGSPEALAELLNLSIADIFPISYDLTGIAVGHPEVI